ncbi:7TM domain-containing protein [Pseudonocardia abyssalis]|uniref:Aspartyl protease family protein n=2 Tax=Pseudonocardia abyssalis TaxID=2792008 RepID=A0ABS6ULM6_9PSEU|nr:7TM domain-containing protein [Pseudonocardia abyssalis]MBW0133159.1 aspartyl protease family protein [Pseudonocardia abyssalis]
MNRIARTPAAIQVLLAVGALLVLGLSVLLTPDRESTSGAGATIGEQELVRITGPNGRTVEAVARIDTGASASSIDTGIAEDLGFDLEDAETITVASSLGREERPIVDGALQIAGQPKSVRFSVTDRSERSNPVLLGRSELTGLQVQVGQQLLTTPGADRAPSTLATLLSQTPALGPLQLLALLPLAVLVVVLLRVFVGVQTLGTFSPVLLAIGYTQAGLVAGVGLTVVIVAAGFVVQPLLRRFRLPRVARLAVLVGVVSVVLVAITQFAGGGTGAIWGTALPVVVTAVMVERLWETWDLDGWRDAARDAAATTVVALLVTALMLAPVVRDLATVAPLTLAIACAVWAGLAGTYRGLRLSELLRFGRGQSDEIPGGTGDATVRLATPTRNDLPTGPPDIPTAGGPATTREMTKR